MAELAYEEVIDETELELVKEKPVFHNQDTFWTVGRHSGPDYNLPGPDGGLYWDRINQEYQRNATQEELDSAAARAKDIQNNFRKRR